MAVSFEAVIHRFTKDMLVWALQTTGGNVARAAVLLGLSDSRMRSLMCRYELQPELRRGRPKQAAEITDGNEKVRDQVRAQLTGLAAWVGEER